jgi:hypothetical protein
LLCGTGNIVVLQALYPLQVISSLFDVADSFDRYEVLSDDARLTQRLHLARVRNPLNPQGEPALVLERYAKKSDSAGAIEPNPPQWTPGDYKITVHLQNPQPWPAPSLFWTPYPHATRATLTVRVRDDKPSVAIGK